MAPLIVVVSVTLLARIFVPWRDAMRIGLAVMFVFTGSAHFITPVKFDLAAMIPPPFTGAMWLIYLTGVFEIAGGIGLLIPKFRRAAAICLVIMLIALFPANVYASLHNVTLRGNAPTPLLLRAPLQILWIAMVWWSSARPRA